MLKEISLEEVKKFWPQSAPNINNIKKYVEKYKNEKIVIKYGGNVLIDRNIFNNFIEDINILNDNFYQNTFRDVNDFYERGLSVRQFYTVPGKKIPNDRNTLAQWLYNSNYNKVSCKEGNDVRCMKNLDLERTDTRRSGIGGERSPP